MISAEDLRALDDFFESIETPGLRKLCVTCGSDLPGSDPAAQRIAYFHCPRSCPNASQLENEAIETVACRANGPSGPSC